MHLEKEPKPSNVSDTKEDDTYTLKDNDNPSAPKFPKNFKDYSTIRSRDPAERNVVKASQLLSLK
jgi:hypothetical protein